MSDPNLSFNERRRFKRKVRQLLNLSFIKNKKIGGGKKLAPGPVSDFDLADMRRHKKRIAISAAAVAVLFIVGLHFYANYRHDQDIKKLGGVKQKTSAIATAKQEENRYKKADDQNLKNGDIESYQIAKLSLVNSYLLQKDYDNAGRLLDDIKKNVPTDKLQTSYFIYRLQIDEHIADVAAQKADLTSLIALYKSQKRDTLAAAYQVTLDKLNGVKTQAPPVDKTKSPVVE